MVTRRQLFARLSAIALAPLAKWLPKPAGFQPAGAVRVDGGLIVRVTKRDIKLGNSRGVELRSRSCPIARAVQRATGQQDVRVGYGRVTVCGVRIQLPNEATKFISQSDKWVEVKPFDFVLEYNRPVPQEESTMAAEVPSAMSPELTASHFRASFNSQEEA